jgi:ATP synthase H subunit
VIELPLVTNEIFNQIVTVEEKADAVVEDAKKEAIRIGLEAKEKAKELIEKAKNEARSKADAMLGAAEAEAKKEAIEIDSRTALEIVGLKKDSLPKIKEARKLCQ